MKLKRSSNTEAEGDAGTAPAKQGAFISARLRNPAEEMAARGSGSSDKLSGILAIVTMIILAIITFMLYTNWSLIKSA